ncbi:hypothetical protein SAMN05216470_1204 [Streptococcus equinus]|uniref:Uncharacterized protein n=1 Tax=Streptococcus equinus TaxID=1335 RepID=A0A239RB41_STREI|nr:hypothetical protein [Streptococcus equinus]SNU07851.1 hypothetical protein SAMN05216470_1204 [Streptococcus equinus]
MTVKEIEIVQLAIAEKLAKAGSEVNIEDALDILDRTKDSTLKEVYLKDNNFVAIWDLLKKHNLERYQLIVA